MRRNQNYLSLSVPRMEVDLIPYRPEPWHIAELMFWFGAGIGFLYFGFGITGGFCLGCAFGAYRQRRLLCLNSVRKLA